MTGSSIPVTGADINHGQCIAAARITALVRRGRRLAAFIQLASDRRVALAEGFAATPSGDVDLVAGLVDDLVLVAELLEGGA